MASGSRAAGRLARLALVPPLVLAASLGGCAEDRAPHPRTARAPALAPAAGQPLLLGAWCSPRVRGASDVDWRAFARAGLTLGVRPLEDTGDPAANAALLARLDTLRLPSPVRVLVRDRRVDPDETWRWGWRDRVRAMVHDAQGHATLAGYFLADEPARRDFGALARLASAVADFDSTHPVYINLAGLGPRASRRDAERWEDAAVHLVRAGRLAQFTFDAYPFARGRESRAFLATLNAATVVSYRTNVPFGAALQFTGFGDTDPATAAQARYQAEEAVLHGARMLVWFTYWTPDPREPDRRWRGGAVAYDGAHTARWDTLAAIDREATTLARWLGDADELVHYGDDLATDTTLAPFRTSLRIGDRYVYEFSGGPATVAGRWSSGRGTTWALVNRDWAHARTFVLRWHEPYPEGHWVLDVQDPQATWRFDGDPERTTCTLAPGGAAVIRDRLAASARD